MRGFSVEYLRSVTDIDDRIIHHAHELGVTTDALAREQERRSREDMEALGNTMVTYARASHFIPQIVSQDERLVARVTRTSFPTATTSTSRAFLAIASSPGGRGPAAGIPVSRVDENPRKRHPGDVALMHDLDRVFGCLAAVPESSRMRHGSPQQLRGAISYAASAVSPRQMRSGSACETRIVVEDSGEHSRWYRDVGTDSQPPQPSPG